MKINEGKMLMAYALGRVACGNGNERKRLKLKEINSEWDHYELCECSYDKSNNSYNLYYEGSLNDQFGKEKFYFRILSITEGWDLNHMIALLIAAIDMHKAEMKTEEEKTKEE